MLSNSFTDNPRQVQAIWPSWYKPPIFRACFIDRAARILGASVCQIRTTSRHRHYAYRRFAIAHVMKDTLGYSYSQIATAIGLKDHSSVINAVRKSRVLVTTDANHAAMVDALEMVA